MASQHWNSDPLYRAADAAFPVQQGFADPVTNGSDTVQEDQRVKEPEVREPGCAPILTLEPVPSERERGLVALKPS